MLIKTDDEIDLYIEVRGKGSPCIFLHGGPGYWSKSFSETAGSLLENHLEMIYLDQRGCGRSSSNTKNYSLKRLLKDIDIVRLSLNIDEFYLMGHSFGGIIAVNYAYYFSRHTKGLILSNVTLNMEASFRHQIKKGSKVLGLEQMELDSNDLMSMFYAIQSELMKQDIYFSLQYKNLKNKTIIDEMDKELMPKPHFQQYIFGAEEYFKDFTLLTKDIDKPALILSGKYDDAIGPEHHLSFNFREGINCVLDSGHHPFIETPNEFAQAIRHFVK
ncbi:alpha/beta fold hydrolase [Peribacillus sp. B-H-3]|uniref:alpha/beta fold hydrolase n=1 Tax=Peribacillus sp. B-H-3 TaxID=3400420 RepID=UPI003B02C672